MKEKACEFMSLVFKWRSTPSKLLQKGNLTLMDTREKNRYEMLIRIGQFGAENAEDFPAGSAGNGNFVTVGEVIEKLREYAADQSSGSGGNVTSRKSVFRDAIRRKMKNYSRTARALAIDNDNLSRLFRVPDGNSDTALLAAAREFVSEAAKYKADFTNFKMPADFIEDLSDDIEDFERLLAESASATGEKVSATAAIDDEIERGMNAARRLDAIVQNVYRDDPAKLAAWTSARHVARTRKTVKPTPPTA